MTLPAIDPSVLLIGATEVARRLSISARTVYVLVETGSMPKPVHLGTRVLRRVEELEEWVRDGCPPLEHWHRREQLPLRPQKKPVRRRGSITGV